MKRETYSLADVRRAIESGVRAGLGEALRSLDETEEEAPYLPASDLDAVRHWIAEKITAHLARAGRGGLRDLARAVGVTMPTIRRWRTRETQVASEHLPMLLEALGTTEVAMKRELRLKTLPRIKARRARRTD